MEKLKLSKQMRRSFERSDLKIDSETRTIEFSFSSERPVERWFGKEVLSHAAGAADLERLNGGANHLFNHNWDKPIGVVEKAWLGDDKRLYAQVRFSKNDFADQVFKDIEDGILKNVSFGYEIKDIVLTEDNEDEGRTYTATKWMPYEISTVTVPADHTVGMGRDLPDDGPEIEVRDLRPAKTEIKIENNAAPAAQKGNSMETQEALKAERERVSGILALGEKYGQQQMASEFAATEKSLADFKTALLEKVATRQAPVSGKDADLGLSEKEVEEFSFMRAFAALANPTSRALRDAAKFEFEISEAAAKKRGKESQGIFVPYEILRATRAREVGTPASGGFLKGTDHRADSFIELLRKKSALQGAGVRVLNGLVGDLAIPKQTGGATAYWLGEAGEPTESGATFGQVAMAPKTVGAYTDITRKLLIQSSPDIEQLIRADLAAVLALAIDYAGIYGTGASNQPLGVVNTAGINTKDFAAANPTFIELIDMESRIAADDADVAGMRYIFNALMRGHLKSTEKFSTTGQTIWEAGGTVNGYPATVSNQLIDGDVIFGNWADMLMGFWSGLDLNVDTAALAKSGGLRLIVLQDVDVAVRHAESFCLGNDDQ